MERWLNFYWIGVGEHCLLSDLLFNCLCHILSNGRGQPQSQIPYILFRLGGCRLYLDKFALLLPAQRKTLDAGSLAHLFCCIRKHSEKQVQHQVFWIWTNFNVWLRAVLQLMLKTKTLVNYSCEFLKILEEILWKFLKMFSKIYGILKKLVKILLDFKNPNLGSTSRKTMTLGWPKPQTFAESQKLSKNVQKHLIEKWNL